MTGESTLGAALTAYRDRNNLPADETSARSWTCALGPLTLRLPNFGWRRRAILAHDLHHVLTGHPCTLRGEFQVAAWEFGAGPMPHWGARLFCQPLVLVGLLWSPRRIWRAYCDGLGSTSLHGRVIDDGLLSAPLRNARRDSARPIGSRFRRCIGFLRLLVEATLIVLTPFLIVAAVWSIAR